MGNQSSSSSSSESASSSSPPPSPSAHHTQASRPGDAARNIEWTLTELMLWQERGREEDDEAERERDETLSPSGLAAGAERKRRTTERDSKSPSRRSTDLTATATASAGGGFAAAAAAPTTSAPAGGTGGRRGRVASDVHDDDVDDYRSHSTSTTTPSPSNEPHAFIGRHLRVLVTAAEHIFMLVAKYDMYRLQAARVTSKTVSAGLSQRVAVLQSAVSSALLKFDNAKAVLIWLQQRHKLTIALKLLFDRTTEILTRVNRLRGPETVRSSDLPAATQRQLIAERERLDGIRHEIKSHVRQLAELKRRGLALGLSYLEQRFNGVMHAAKLAAVLGEGGVRLFQLLKISTEVTVTARDIERAVATMEDNVNSLSQLRVKASVQREQTERELSEFVGTAEEKSEVVARQDKLCAAIADVSAQRKREAASLKQVHDFFQAGFIESVFTELQSLDTLETTHATQPEAAAGVAQVMELRTMSPSSFASSSPSPSSSAHISPSSSSTLLSTLATPPPAPSSAAETAPIPIPTPAPATAPTPTPTPIPVSSVSPDAPPAPSAPSSDLPSSSA